MASGCTVFTVDWTPATGAAIRIPTTLPTGETFVQLPAGQGYLNRVADCGYTIRFESA